MTVRTSPVSRKRMSSRIERCVSFVVISRDDPQLFALVPLEGCSLEFSEPLQFGHSMHVFGVAEHYAAVFEELLQDKSAVVKFHRCKELYYV